MRRLPIALASVSAVAVIASLVVAPAAQAAPAPLSPSVNLKGTTIQPSLFGMHVFNLEDGVFPTVPVGAIRLWDNETTWSAIETAQDQFNWAKLDGAVTTARSNGVTDILMVLAGTPSWGTDDPASGGAAGVLPGAAGMPKDLADWDDWVRQVATRYKGQITAYQPWNEANLITFSTGTPQEMAQLTKRAYDIIKSIDPAATVVAPSTGTRLGGPFKRFYPAFLRELKALGWPVDVWAAHTYPASLGTPVDRAGLARTFQSVLAAEGAPDLPIWDTENNFGLAGPGAENPDQDIVDRRAADWTARTYLDSLRLGISRVYWYAWGPENDLVGIQMNTGSPAAKAYATLQDWIVGATFNGCSPAGRNDVTCRFAKDGKIFRIVYPEVGRAAFPTKGFSQVCALNGTCKPVTRAKVRTFSPVLLRK
jgi:polysaccharide biosynthesis protein PslG